MAKRFEILTTFDDHTEDLAERVLENFLPDSVIHVDLGDLYIEYLEWKCNAVRPDYYTLDRVMVNTAEYCFKGLYPEYEDYKNILVHSPATNKLWQRDYKEFIEGYKFDISKYVHFCTYLSAFLDREFEGVFIVASFQALSQTNKDPYYHENELVLQRFKQYSTSQFICSRPLEGKGMGKTSLDLGGRKVNV